MEWPTTSTMSSRSFGTASESVLGDLEDGAIREKVRQIDLAAQHASALTFQLLAFSRHQVLQSEQIDLNESVRSTSEMAGRLVGEHVQVELELDESVAHIEMDRGQLQQVILNLFVNARDAMPGGGRLRVRTSSVVLGDAYVDDHFEVPRGDYVLLEITDTGKGMDAETSSRIFDPFFTTKIDGTGLGLATVYGIIRQSGGQVFVYSELGIGTTFKIYLPPARAAESSAEAPVLPKHASHEGNETILLVEDADLLRPLVVEILRASGYNVLAAADGFEALSLFESSNGTIDLLLTDVVMPGMSGRELAEQVLERSPTLRVIFTSGYPDDTSIHALIDQRHIAFIQKPYAGKELLATIRETLAS